MSFFVVLIDLPFDLKWILMRIEGSKVECSDFAIDAYAKELLTIVKKVLGKRRYSTFTRWVCA